MLASSGGNRQKMNNYPFVSCGNAFVAIRDVDCLQRIVYYFSINFTAKESDRSSLSIESLHNESLLVQAMQAGSEEAFTTLYRHYSPQLYINIMGMIRDPLLAEEMVQELFTRIWQKRESIGRVENFPGYIYRIGQHLVHDFFRKVQRDRRLLERFRIYAEEKYEHIEEAINYQQSSAMLEKAIDQLSPQQKRVYQLVKEEGFTYKKAAAILDISPLTVKEYLVSANKSIRSYITEHMDGMPALLLFLALTSLR